MEFLLSLVFIILLGIIEFFQHKSNRRAIPLVIHVNGTRGKSTTTRLLTYGLLECGYKVWGKTTGSEPRLIKAAGEKEIKRRGQPRIKEQQQIISQAAAAGVEVLVLECMALSPEIQYTTGNKIVQADYSLLTNIYRDHEEIMGDTLKDIKETLFLSIPAGGRVVLPANVYESFFAASEQEKGVTGVSFYPVKKEKVKEDFLESFSYPNFPENIALARRCSRLLAEREDLEINSEEFSRGMLKAPPDPGNTGVNEIKLGQKNLVLINGFAANDIPSTKALWRRYAGWLEQKRPERFKPQRATNALENIENPKTVVALLNLRADRQLRSSKMIACYEDFLAPKITTLYLVGPKNKPVLSVLRNNSSQTITYLGDKKEAAEILTAIKSQEETDCIVIFGFGNFKGEGQRLREYFAEKGV